jgi:hypothetical protein
LLEGAQSEFLDGDVGGGLSLLPEELFLKLLAELGPIFFGVFQELDFLAFKGFLGLSEANLFCLLGSFGFLYFDLEGLESEFFGEELRGFPLLLLNLEVGKLALEFLALLSFLL